jgi:hypothetical protein
MIRGNSLAGTAAAAWLVGCTGQLPDVAPGEGSGGAGGGSTSNGPREGKLSTNGLALDLDALASLDLDALGSWRSESQAVTSSASLADLMDRSSGLEHVEYLALCALDEGTELVAVDRSGDEVAFPGLYGLAPEWVTESCGASCQRWLTACLVAHANAFDYRVAVSLRGSHRGLVWDDDIAADFPLQEGAFYGNAFASQPVAYSCAGRALVDLDGDVGAGAPLAGDSDSYLTRRICSVGQPCGLELTGLCHVSTGPSGPGSNELGSTCALDAGQARYYGDCSTSVAGPVLGAPTYAEVITTYLARD